MVGGVACMTHTPKHVSPKFAQAITFFSQQAQKPPPVLFVLLLQAILLVKKYLTESITSHCSRHRPRGENTYNTTPGGRGGFQIIVHALGCRISGVVLKGVKLRFWLFAIIYKSYGPNYHLFHA